MGSSENRYDAIFDMLAYLTSRWVSSVVLVLGSLSVMDYAHLAFSPRAGRYRDLRSPVSSLFS